MGAHREVQLAGCAQDHEHEEITPKEEPMNVPAA
jgi:hypothetical protein